MKLQMFRYIAAPLSLLVSCLVTLPAQAEDNYPRQPISIIIPFNPGGGADPIGRLMAEELGQILGNPIVVENIPGASGSLGYAHVARASADGYKLLMSYSSTTSCSPVLQTDTSWKVADFDPLIGFANSGIAISVPGDLPVNTLAEFIEYSRDPANAVNYAIAGRGTLGHITSELMILETGAKMEQVIYKSSGDVMPDLLAGRVQMLMTGVPAIAEHKKSGALKILAVTSAARHPLLPDVPTVAEAGLPALEGEDWYGFFVRAGTAAPIEAKIIEATKKALAQPDFIEKGKKAGINYNLIDPNEIMHRVQREADLCRDVVEKTGIEKG